MRSAALGVAGWQWPQRVFEAGEYLFERAFIEGPVLGPDEAARAFAARSDVMVLVGLDQTDGL